MDKYVSAEVPLKSWYNMSRFDRALNHFVAIMKSMPPVEAFEGHPAYENVSIALCVFSVRKSRTTRM